MAEQDEKHRPLARRFDSVEAVTPRQKRAALAEARKKRKQPEAPKPTKRQRAQQSVMQKRRGY